MDSSFPTAQQVHDNWEAQKAQMLREHGQDLQQVYGNLAKFDADGPKKAAQFRMDHFLSTSPTLAVASMGVIAMGAAAGSMGLGLVGTIALGKVVLDVIRKGYYNDAVDRHQALQAGLQAANTPEEGAQVLQDAQAAATNSAPPSRLARHLGIIAAGSAIGLAAMAAAPAVGIGMATAAGVGAAVITAKGMGDLFKEESLASLSNKAIERTLNFAERLAERRDATQPEVGIEPNRPRSP